MPQNNYLLTVQYPENCVKNLVDLGDALTRRVSPGTYAFGLCRPYFEGLFTDGSRSSSDKLARLGHYRRGKSTGVKAYKGRARLSFDFNALLIVLSF